MNISDKILVKTKTEEFIGTLMPSTDKNTIFIKLDTGYNIGISRDNLVKIDVIEEHKSTEHSVEDNVFKLGLKTISILHTGGTIASKVDYTTGATIAKFTPSEILSLFPELNNIANIKSRLIGNIMSENMRFSDYNSIIKEIINEIKEGADGVIVTHGTDTMHYTSAALSFALQNLPVPVILVGAQRSSDRGSTDAYQNIISAAYFIVNTDFLGVGICMHENSSDESCVILSGLNSRKMHSSRRDAFVPVNSLPIARVFFNEHKIEYLNKNYNKTSGEFKTGFFNEKIKVGILRTHTNMFPDEFSVFETYDGLVIEGMGLGHAPILMHKDNEEIFKILKELSSKMPVVLTLQTIYGRVNMNVYSPGRMLLEIGVLGNLCDMTTETAFIKLAFLLSNYGKKEVRELIGKNICGEISEQSIYK